MSFPRHFPCLTLTLHAVEAQGLVEVETAAVVVDWAEVQLVLEAGHHGHGVAAQLLAVHDDEAGGGVVGQPALQVHRVLPGLQTSG